MSKKRMLPGSPVNRNDLLDVTIEDFTREGEGIGRAGGYTLFVKDALIGDTVRARITKPGKTYAYARVEEVLTPSPDRTEAACPEARRCGGCRFQEYDYAAQLRWKRRLVRDALDKIGGLAGTEVLPVIGMEHPFRYRNKAQYPVGTVKGELEAGFYAGRTHSIIPVRDCRLTPEVYADILGTTLAFMRHFHIPPYNEQTGEGVVRHLLIRSAFSTGEILVCPVINGRKMPHANEYVSRMLEIPGIRSICVNINTKRGNVILGERTESLHGEPYITDVLDGLTFRVSPRSFYQVNPAQTEILYREAVRAAGLTGKEVVYDLYCGIGTISLFLARSAKAVYGVEIVPDAIRDAKENAALNGIGNARFYAGAAEEIVTRGYFPEGEPCPAADVVVLDPPRKGCDAALIRAVRRMAPGKIVYVSCDPATLARDLKLFTEEGDGSGYRVERVQPVDMFPETQHIETVVLLRQQQYRSM